MLQTKTRWDREALVIPFYSLYILLLFLAGKVGLSVGIETLSKGQSLSGSQTIVSQDGTFELGFFSTGKSNNTYVGIWYKDFAEKTIVWVANREAPISNTSRNSKLEISGNGDLALYNDSTIVWSTNLMLSQPSSLEAVLLDTGNFVLRESSKPFTVFWESFKYPTDTWLPGAKFGFSILPSSLEPQRLISWKNSEDPSPGMFSAVMDTDTSGGELLLEWNKSVGYWSSGVWTGIMFSSVPEMSLVANVSLVATPNEAYYTYSSHDISILSRLVMDASGQLKLFTTMRAYHTWTLIFLYPKNQYDIYAFCGEFGVVRYNSVSSCTCLQGFVPFSNENENTGNGIHGCERKTRLKCENSTTKGKNDGFLRISNLKLPNNSKEHKLNEKQCKSACLEDCSCTAYAYVGSLCSTWSGALLNFKEVSDAANDRQDLYVKAANSELPNASGNKKRLMIIIAVVVSVVGPTLGGFICFGTRKMKQKGRGKKHSSQDLLSFDFSSSSAGIDNQMQNVNGVRKGSKNDFDLPLFSYASVSAATNNFSASNKLGEGGFGPVYKGKSLKGQEIAVKRLSRRSGQGLEEFRNEMLLIAKLQHRNLVRLLGCCIEQDENILIYEYMPNKSLDFFLFDSKKQVTLEWRTRVCIIEGIAQGILYLHQYSRLRIIHRDLKASNILLDSEMSPRISDFGMARIFGGNNSEANTKRIVGTYGYMAPEYALEGLFSIKSDVFSFGVLVLETVSGKKNTGFYNSDSLNLIGQAWELWMLNRALELTDPSLRSPPPAAVLRCINIGLLCVQENPNDRPTMSNVVSMLGNELVALPSPKKPAFTAIRTVVETGTTSTSGNARNVSVNELTVSTVEPR